MRHVSGTPVDLRPELADLVWSGDLLAAGIADASGVIVDCNATFRRLADREPVGELVSRFVGLGQEVAFASWLGSIGRTWEARPWAAFADRTGLAPDYEVSAHRDSTGRVVLVGQPMRASDLESGLLELNRLLASDYQGAIRERDHLDLAVAEAHTELEAMATESVAVSHRLELAHLELAAFSSALNHDLRGPLRAIAGYAALLERRYGERLDDRGRHYVDVVARASERLGVFVDELVEYASVGHGDIRREPVDVRALLDRVWPALVRGREAAGATLDIREPLAMPLGDPDLVEVILRELLENAIAFHRPGRPASVSLASTAASDWVTLTVTDRGIGMAPEHHQRIFEIFTGLDPEGTAEGSGIGLAIARKAAGLLGGSITVGSVEGAGSTFSVRLPAAVRTGSPGPPR
jgi:signal transduction histidine kinase